MTSSQPEADLSAAPLDERDERILRAVRELHARLDPPPSGLADRVKFELTLAALHAEIAELELSGLAGVRTAGTDYDGAATVTFTASSLSLMVTLTPEDERWTRVDGWVTGGGMVVELHAGPTVITATTDAHGRFVMERVARGPARFVVLPPTPADRPVATPTLEL